MLVRIAAATDTALSSLRRSSAGEAATLRRYFKQTPKRRRDVEADDEGGVVDDESARATLRSLRPRDVDEAFLRPGRLGECVFVRVEVRGEISGQSTIDLLLNLKDKYQYRYPNENLLNH